MSRRTLRVLFVSPEVAPFAKTGGLADIAASLPAALTDEGIDLRVIMPLYHSVREHLGVDRGNDDAVLPAIAGLAVPLERGTVLRSGRLRCLAGTPAVENNGGVPPGCGWDMRVPIYFVEQDRYFGRPLLYGAADSDYSDNLERFSFFSLAVLAALRALRWAPDVVHLNDWQTALTAFYLREPFQAEVDWQRIGLLLTIHNLSYQGLFAREEIRVANIPDTLFHPQALEFYGRFNVLKAGMLYADVLSTVSERYATDVQTEEYGCGLDGVLRERSDRLYGVVKGVDYRHWNPEVDPFLPAHYSAGDLSGKRVCKRALLEAFGMPAEDEVPVFGMISRLIDQKGVDILAYAMHDLMKENLRVVVLGIGEERYQRLFQELAELYPGRLGVRIELNEALAHLIEAGSDFFVMPSRYEPCGLNQIYSLRYGTLPVVRAAGGLDDTVRSFSWEREEGNGFKFNDPFPDALVWAVKEAARLYENAPVFDLVRRRAMAEDYSWKRSAKRYAWLYHKAVEAAQE